MLLFLHFLALSATEGQISSHPWIMTALPVQVSHPPSQPPPWKMTSLPLEGSPPPEPLEVLPWMMASRPLQASARSDPSQPPPWMMASGPQQPSARSDPSQSPSWRMASFPLQDSPSSGPSSAPQSPLPPMIIQPYTGDPEYYFVAVLKNLTTEPMTQNQIDCGDNQGSTSENVPVFKTPKNSEPLNRTSEQDLRNYRTLQEMFANSMFGPISYNMVSGNTSVHLSVSEPPMSGHSENIPLGNMTFPLMRDRNNQTLQKMYEDSKIGPNVYDNENFPGDPNREYFYGAETSYDSGKPQVPAFDRPSPMSSSSGFSNSLQNKVSPWSQQISTTAQSPNAQSPTSNSENPEYLNGAEAAYDSGRPTFLPFERPTSMSNMVPSSSGRQSLSSASQQTSTTARQAPSTRLPTSSSYPENREYFNGAETSYNSGRPPFLPVERPPPMANILPRPSSPSGVSPVSQQTSTTPQASSTAPPTSYSENREYFNGVETLYNSGRPPFLPFERPTSMANISPSPSSPPGVSPGSQQTSTTAQAPSTGPPTSSSYFENREYFNGAETSYNNGRTPFLPFERPTPMANILPSPTGLPSVSSGSQQTSTTVPNTRPPTSSSYFKRYEKPPQAKNGKNRPSGKPRPTAMHLPVSPGMTQAIIRPMKPLTSSPAGQSDAAQSYSNQYQYVLRGPKPKHQKLLVEIQKSIEIPFEQIPHASEMSDILTSGYFNKVISSPDMVTNDIQDGGREVRHKNVVFEKPVKMMDDGNGESIGNQLTSYDQEGNNYSPIPVVSNPDRNYENTTLEAINFIEVPPLPDSYIEFRETPPVNDQTPMAVNSSDKTSESLKPLKRSMLLTPATLQSYEKLFNLAKTDSNFGKTMLEDPIVSDTSNHHVLVTKNPINIFVDDPELIKVISKYYKGSLSNVLSQPSNLQMVAGG